MRILVGCEFSGIVREAFSELGHDAWSCDLLPTEKLGPHFQCDIRDILADGWDILLVFPPCTHLAVSGARWFSEKQEEQHLALEFIQLLLDAPISKICLENPVGVISTRIRKPDQIIQPYYFGHPESKRTCLWLKNLPKLIPTNILDLPASGVWANQTPSGQNKLGPSNNRWKKRSKTYPNIAKAMANQWGRLYV